MFDAGRKSAHAPLTVVPKPEWSRPKPEVLRVFRQLLSKIAEAKRQRRVPGKK